MEMINKEELKNIAESIWRKQQAKIYLIFYFIMVAIILIGSFVSSFISIGDLTENIKIALSIFSSLFLLFSIIFLPVVLYYYYQYVRIIKNYDKYELYEVKLDSPGTSLFYKGAVYYTVKFKTSNNKYVSLDTKPMFSDSFISKFPLSEYNNQVVKVLYNQDSDEIIVVGK